MIRAVKNRTVEISSSGTRFAASLDKSNHLNDVPRNARWYRLKPSTYTVVSKFSRPIQTKTADGAAVSTLSPKLQGGYEPKYISQVANASTSPCRRAVATPNSLIASHIILSMSKQNISILRDQECITRDGTILRGDVYYQAASAPQPVLVCRTPYNKLTQRYQETAISIAEGGYVAVVQDMRGRYTSDGEYRWMWMDKNETFDVEDGYDTIEWAAKLPHSDGRVGTWGHSNASWAIWMTLHSNPPSLVAALASGISMSMLDITFGVWETGRRLEWTYMMAADVRRREGRTDGPTDPVEATYRWNAVERSKYVWWLPLADIPEHVFAGLTDQYQTFLRNTNQDYMRFDDAHPKVDVPVMQITGWWDRLIGTIDNYEGLITNGDPDRRNQHRLIVGPWGHDATNYNGKIGPIDYGPKADTTYADLIVRWYDYDLKGVDNGTADEKPVQLFILNRNEWIGADAWPLPETRYTDLYLSSGGSANSVHGDGTLSFDVPTNAVSDEFDYDPRDPVMSLMHQNSQSIPINQAPNDHRQDILVYETVPMTEDLDVIGPVRLKLWASTDAPETDFAAKLAIVHEDGLCVNLTYGIIRTRYRDGFDQVANSQPGKPYQYDIKLNPIGCRFLKGQRIRLFVSSSDFPNFDRNHNTGNDFWSDTEFRVAHQTIFHAGGMASRLILPIVP